MKKAYLILVLVVLVSFDTFSQMKKNAHFIEGCTLYSQINPKIGRLKFAVNVDTSFQPIIRMKIYDDREKLLQTIYTDENESMDLENNKPYIIFSDLNCDGYNDIQLEQWRGATGNVKYLIWLYNSRKNNFIFSQNYSERTSISVDCSKKIVSSFYRFEGGQYSIDTLKIMKDSLEWISSYEESVDWENNKKIMIHSMKKDGKIIETKTIKDNQ